MLEWPVDAASSVWQQQHHGGDEGEAEDDAEDLEQPIAAGIHFVRQNFEESDVEESAASDGLKTAAN